MPGMPDILLHKKPVVRKSLQTTVHIFKRNAILRNKIYSGFEGCLKKVWMSSSIFMAQCAWKNIRLLTYSYHVSQTQIFGLENADFFFFSPWYKISTKMVQMVQKGCKNCSKMFFKMVQNQSKNGSKLVQKWFKISPKMVQN